MSENLGSFFGVLVFIFVIYNPTIRLLRGQEKYESLEFVQNHSSKAWIRTVGPLLYIVMFALVSALILMRGVAIKALFWKSYVRSVGFVALYSVFVGIFQLFSNVAVHGWNSSKVGGFCGWKERAQVGALSLVLRDCCFPGLHFHPGVGGLMGVELLVIGICGIHAWDVYEVGRGNHF